MLIKDKFLKNRKKVKNKKEITDLIYKNVQEHYKLTRFDWFNKILNNKFVLWLGGLGFTFSVILLIIFIFIVSFFQQNIYIILIFTVCDAFLLLFSFAVLYYSVLSNLKIKKLFLNNEIIEKYYDNIFTLLNNGKSEIINIKILNKLPFQLFFNHINKRKIRKCLVAQLGSIMFVYGIQNHKLYDSLTYTKIIKKVNNIYFIKETDIDQEIHLQPISYQWNKQFNYDIGALELTDFYSNSSELNKLSEIKQIKLFKFIKTFKIIPKIIISKKIINFLIKVKSAPVTPIGVFYKNKTIENLINNDYNVGNIIDKISDDYTLIEYLSPLIRAI